MSAVKSPPHYFSEEYLVLERSASFKSELHEGQAFAMTSASRAHNLIALNVGDGTFRSSGRCVGVDGV